MRKLRRLSEMSPGEIAYRLHERMRMEVERARVCLLGPHTARGLGHLPSRDGSFKAYLEETAVSRFYFPAAGETRESLRCFVESTFPEWIENAIVDAESTCSHTAELAGHGTVELGRNINWHRDPITGRVWPRRFWANYNPVGDDSFGDVKNVNELNRHQFLPRLGKAYFLTGDERYANEALAMLDSWIEQNPEACGINWQSSLEIAIRSLSWLWTIFFILPAECFDEKAARRIGRSLFRQLRHVAAYPSTYSSPNTHLIGEAAVLFIAGSLFPDSEEAAHWREMGRGLLVEQAPLQMLPDGVYIELSTYYHCYALDFYLQALLLARRLDDCFPREVWTGVEHMMEFLMHVAHPDGSVPLLGDDDGGRALALGSGSYRSFQDALSTGVVLFCRSDFKHQSGGFHQETLWQTGERGFSIYRAVCAVPPRETSRVFSAGGYYTHYSGWGPRDAHLVFDCGATGMPQGGHAHADELSVVLFAHGAPLLVDPGTCIYNAEPALRSFFRSTRAHNTASVDGRDQSEMAGTFQWKRRASGRISKRFGHAGVEFVEAEHDGFASMAESVVHRRRLLYCPPGYWVIADDFRGAGRHLFDFFYHLPPGAELGLHETEGAPVNLLMRRGPAGLLLYFDAVVPPSASIRCGETDPVQGWVSGRYGERRAAPVLHTSFRSAVPAAAVSVAVPFSSVDQDFPPEPYRVDAIEGALACAIDQERFTDFVVLPQNGVPVTFVDSELSGDFFWIRTRGTEITQLVAINARYFTHRRSPVFEYQAPVEYVSVLFSGERVVLHCGEAQDKVYVRNLRNLEVRPG